MSGPRHAVILAAGMGSRLSSLGHPGPKGALQLHHHTIIEESIERLYRAGIARITIVTGYQAEFYEGLASLQPERIETVHNPKFADSGSMYSLYLAAPRVSGEFLLLESDLIYEQRALTSAMDNHAANLLLLSGPTEAGDEVYVETDANRLLRAMSKDKSTLGELIAGELVGISKISAELYAEMCSYARIRFQQSLHLDYETDALVGVCRSNPVHCLTIDDLLWSEIDDEAHYRRAREIHALIRSRDGDTV